MAPKKTAKKHIIAHHFPAETASEKRNARLGELQDQIDALKLEVKNLTERVAALEAAED